MNVQMDDWKTEVQKAVEEILLPAFNTTIAAQFGRFFKVTPHVNTRVITINFPPAVTPIMVEDFYERMGRGREGRYWRVDDGKIIIHVDLEGVRKNFFNYLIFLDDVEGIWWGIVKKNGANVKPPTLSALFFGTSTITDGSLTVTNVKVREGKKWGLLFKEKTESDLVPMEYVLNKMAEGIALLAFISPYCGTLGKWLLATFNKIKSNITGLTFNIMEMQVKSVSMITTPALWRVEWLGCTAKSEGKNPAEIIFMEVGVPLHATCLPANKSFSTYLSGVFYLTVFVTFSEHVASSKVESVVITPEVIFVPRNGESEVIYKSPTKREEWTFEFKNLPAPVRVANVINVQRLLNELACVEGNADVSKDT